MNRTKAIAASYLGVIAYASLVFIGAWKFYYWQGITYVALAVFGTTVSHLLTPSGSDLAARRVRDAKSGQDWDKRLLGALFVINTATFLVAGMDSGRFMWSGLVPLSVTIAGAILMIAGQLVFAFSKRENAFFSSTVQIQAEHGHAVCETGPYRLVRHPGYLGMLLSVAAFPLVMGSYWALVPAAMSMVVLIVRAALEDRFLLDSLPGYLDYAKKTKFKLLPGLL